MMNRDVLGRQMFAKGGVARQRITDTYILETIQNLQNAMREGNAAVAAYVQENLRDLQDIAAVYPQVAPIINKGIDVLQSQTVPSLRQPMAPQMGKSLGDLMTPAPDGSMDYYAPGPFGYENGPEAPVMPEGPSEEDLRRYQENERGDQFLIPKPMPEMPSMGGGAPIEGVPMQMGGDPRAAAMAAMGAAPAAMPAAPAAMPAAPAAMPPMGAPMPTDQGPVMDEGIASQLPPEVMQILGAAARSFGDPEKAESFEEMMNMIRGVPASEEERRMELAGVVGEQDAQQTPESVLTLVQPVMLLMGAEEGGGAPVDQGIGSVAQEAMNVPVEGPMAEGIMSMAGEGASPPANFNRGGEVRRFDEGGGVTYDVNPAYTTVEPIPFPVLGGSEEDRKTINAARYIDAAANLPPLSQKTSPSMVPDLGQTAAERLKIYQQIMGASDQEDKDLAQAQFYQDLAKFGFSLMQPGRPGENVLAQAGRAAQEVGLGQNTLNLLAKQQAAKKAQDQAIKLASITASEAEITAAKKAEAEAAAAETKARAKAASDYMKAKVSVEKDVVRREHITDDGTKVSLVQQSTLTPDYKITRQPYVVETVNGKPVVIAKPGEDIREIIDVASGNTILTKSVGGGPYRPVLGPDNQPVPTKLVQVKWDSRVQPDGKTVVQKVNATTLEPVKGPGNTITLPAETETITVPGFPGQLFAKNKTTGVVTPVANLQGKRDKNIVIVNGNVVALDPETGKPDKITPVAPGVPELRVDAAGRLGYVSAPTEKNPNGVFTAVDGAEAKGKRYTYQTWVDPVNNQVRVVYQIDGGQKLFDYETGLEAALTGFVPISADTAFGSAKELEQGRRRDQSYRETLRANLRAVVNQSPEDYVDRVFGAELSRLSGAERARARAERLELVKGINADAQKIARETNQTLEEVIASPINLREQLDKGTGLWPRVRAGISSAGAAIFNTNFWSSNRDARQFVTLLSLDLKIAAANSPRFAEGEQIRLKPIVADVDAWLTNGRIEENKLRVLKSQMAAELQNIRLRLAGGTPGARLPELSKTVRAQLETADVSISNGLRMLQQIPMYTDTSRLRNTSQSDAAGAEVERALRESGGLQ